jgi:hypothetical protein
LFGESAVWLVGFGRVYFQEAHARLVVVAVEQRERVAIGDADDAAPEFERPCGMCECERDREGEREQVRPARLCTDNGRNSPVHEVGQRILNGMTQRRLTGGSCRNVVHER